MKSKQILTALQLTGSKDNQQYAGKLEKICAIIAELKKLHFFAATLGTVLTCAEKVAAMPTLPQPRPDKPDSDRRSRIEEQDAAKRIVNSAETYQAIKIEYGDADPMVHGYAGSYTFDIPTGNDFTAYVLQLAGLQQAPQQTAKKAHYKATLTAGALDKIKAALLYVSSDTLRPAMTGVCLTFEAGKVRVAATDCHRLYTTQGDACEVSSTKRRQFIIPLEACKALVAVKRVDKAEPVTFTIHRQTTITQDGGTYPNTYRTKRNRKILEGLHPVVTNKLTFGLTTAGQTITGEPIDARFPDFDCVIPQDNPYKVEVNRKTLLQHLATNIPMANQITKQVKLIFTDKVTIEAFDIDFGRESQTTFDHVSSNVPERLALAFNGILLTQMLKALDCTTVLLEVSTPYRAALITDSRTSDIRILMPMAIYE
jgi:DNA polymerase III sliding clamp (beta) subunit (PCNA family)